MIIDYGYGDREFEFGVAALVEYEQQFGGDLIKDLFGKVEVSEDSDDVIVDFTKTEWTTCVKALWAAEKGLNPSTPGFRQWCRENPKPDMNIVTDAVCTVAVEDFFHTGAGSSD